jgi:glycosyltransferase involved in cell wall biosynthesis
MQVARGRRIPSMTRRPQILFILPSLGGGGAERVILTLLRHWDREQCSASLAVLDGRTVAEGYSVPAGVEIIEVRRARVRQALIAVTLLLRRRRFDVVVGTMWHLNLGLALVKPLLPRGIKLVAREASAILNTLATLRGHRVWLKLYRSLYRRFDLIICQSTAMKAEMIEMLDIPPSRAIVIHNPVDIEAVRRLSCQPIPGEFVEWWSGERTIPLVTAGRLSAEKGFDTLIDALALLSREDVRLLILGTGPLRAELEDLAKRKGVAAQVRLAGFQSNPYAFFARAQAFVFSSRFDAFPNVVLEALACGTGVVGIPAPGGIKEIVKDRPGCLLATSTDANSLAEAIASLLARHTVRPVISAPQEYNARSIAKRYVSALTDLVDGTR